MTDAPAAGNGLVGALEDAGYRLTEPRRAVAEMIAGRDGHFTAAELVDEARDRHPGLGRATVFRALDLFTSLNLVERVDLPGGRPRVRRLRAGPPPPRDLHPLRTVARRRRHAASRRSSRTSAGGRGSGSRPTGWSCSACAPRARRTTGAVRAASPRRSSSLSSSRRSSPARAAARRRRRRRDRRPRGDHDDDPRGPRRPGRRRPGPRREPRPQGRRGPHVRSHAVRHPARRPTRGSSSATGWGWTTGWATSWATPGRRRRSSRSATTCRA